MRKGCFSRYQLLTVSNLAKVSVRCTGLLQGQNCQCIWPNFGKIAKSQNLVSKEPPVSHAEKPPIHSLVWHKYIKVCVILASTKLRRITFVCHVLHQRPTSVFLSVDERDDEDKETFPLYWMHGSWTARGLKLGCSTGDTNPTLWGICGRAPGGTIWPGWWYNEGISTIGIAAAVNKRNQKQSMHTI